MNSFEIKQTVRFLKSENGLKNEIEMIASVDVPMQTTLTMDGVAVWSGELCTEGQSVFFAIDEPTAEREALFALSGVGEQRVVLRVPKKYEVHVIQLSHHDPGYTDIPSHVLEESSRFLRCALDDMDAREDYPEDERYRIVIEQSYSIKRFLDTASPADRERMMSRIRRGDVELTALFANLVSEILSPEQMLRALYPSEQIAQESGVPIICAAHNDIPGFSWGYCTALCRAGIKMFMPALPSYYTWGCEGMTSFWDVERIFGSRRPGAFWWESAEGERVLFYCNNAGCNGEKDITLPKLFRTLEEIDRENYAHTLIRWPVQSSNRDNSYYVPDYVDYIREYNKTYAYPRLISSTESRFYREFRERECDDLPVWRGGVHGQDYPLGSISQMASSAVSRETHALHRQAELLYSIVREDDELSDQRPRLASAMTDMLMADEHAYGFTFPACKGQRASFWEHGVYAMRANADAHDVRAKALASIADRVGYDGDEYRLTVVNTSGLGGRYAVHAPLRDPDNNGTEIRRLKRDGQLHICELSTRMHVHPQDGFLDGSFRLLDAATGEEVRFTLRRVGWDDPGELCALRDGIAQGTKRMGLFEDPSGVALELCFSTELPPYGYKTFLLSPCQEKRALPTQDCPPDIENEFYRVRFADGRLSLIDRESGEELFDASCEVAPLSILVRNGQGVPTALDVQRVSATKSGVDSTITLSGSGDGVYSYRTTVTLTEGVDRVDVQTRLVKNEKPLQTLFMAFPLVGDSLRYQGVLHESTPTGDLLPGSHADAIAVQDYVYCEGSDLLWSSANAPVVFLSHLWGGYVSPAHCCISNLEHHEPLRAEQFDTAHVYSVLTSNNFGTNFFPSQLAAATFCYSIAKRRGRSRALVGSAACSQIATLLTDRSRGSLPMQDELLTVTGGRVLTLKVAEDGDGLILRMINDADTPATASVSVMGKRAMLVCECDVLERPLDTRLTYEAELLPHRLYNFRIKESEAI